MNGIARVGRHAALRFVERVDDGLTIAEARTEVERILRSGHRHGYGRAKWGQYLQLRDGCVVVEDALNPGVAVIEGHGVALTTVVEGMFTEPTNTKTQEVDHV